jgi:hypothetical protein
MRDLTNEQRRQFTDAQQAFDAYREAQREFLHAYEGTFAGGMHWRTVGGVEYLYRTRRRVASSLGRRSPETEAIKAAYVQDRDRRRRRLRQMEKRLSEMAPVNRAMGLGRVPNVVARIMLTLDEERLLGRSITVVGTNALHAYEARAGVQLDSGVVATGDVDLLWDARRRLSLASGDLRAEGLIGLLRKVDRSFERSKSRYSAVNDQLFRVDLICPNDKAFLTRPSDALSEVADDLQASGIEGLDWLVNAPKFDEVAIAENGRPVPLNVVDPRVFALHKAWLSKRSDREPVKRERDAAQARVAADLATRYFALDLGGTDLSALPASIRAMRRELS